PGTSEPEALSEENNSPAPAYDPTGNQTYFVGEIANLGIAINSGFVAFPDSRDFEKANADSFLNFADPINPGPLSNSLDAKYLDEQLTDVIKILIDSYGGSVSITPIDDYAGELLYELSDQEGNVFMHVSLVEFKSGSTLIVMWPENPNGG
ncbi:MAG: hypothetical protein AAF635_12530, partial [Cyanobacteria bacterium P01_C01_bin.69]